MRVDPGHWSDPGSGTALHDRPAGPRRSTSDPEGPVPGTFGRGQPTPFLSHCFSWGFCLYHRTARPWYNLELQKQENPT